MTPVEEALREVGLGAEYDAGYAEGYPVGLAEGRAGAWPERQRFIVPLPAPAFTLGRAEGWFAGWAVGYAEGLT